MARVLVTGGAGFIGSHVADLLLDQGHEVSVFDNLATGRRENVHPRARLHEVDLRDAEATFRVVEAAQPEYVHHLAAQPNVRISTERPAYDADVNIIGALNLLEACHAVGVKRLVYSSSGGAIYGEHGELPLTEDAPIVPISPYGVSKYTVELYLKAANVVWGLEYVILRYANVYGPRQDPKGEAGVVSLFTDAMLAGEQPRIFGDGGATRDYVHVSDVARANLAAMSARALNAYNVGTGVQTSVRELFDALAAVAGFTVEPIYDDPRPGEIRHSMVDATRLRTDTGWRPEFDLAAGLRDTFEYYRAKKGTEPLSGKAR